LPLTIEPHDKPHVSFLSSKNKDDISLQGLVNLLILLLITYHSRAVIQSLEQNNLVLIDLVRDFWRSGVYLDWRNYQTLMACILLTVFTTISFGIEKLAGQGAPAFIVSEYSVLIGFRQNL
jgi:hypothetical protein